MQSQWQQTPAPTSGQNLPHVLRSWPWDAQHPPESRYLVAELGPRVWGVANEPHLLHGTQNLRIYWRGSPTKHASTQRLLRLAASLHKNLAGCTQGPTGGTRRFLPLTHCPRTSGFIFCHYKVLGLHQRSAEHKCLGHCSGREKKSASTHAEGSQGQTRISPQDCEGLTIPCSLQPCPSVLLCEGELISHLLFCQPRDRKQSPAPALGGRPAAPSPGRERIPAGTGFPTPLFTGRDREITGVRGPSWQRASPRAASRW